MARHTVINTYTGGASDESLLDSDALRTQINLPANLLGQGVVVELQGPGSDAWDTLEQDGTKSILPLPEGLVFQKVRFSGAPAGTYPIRIVQN